MATWIKLLKHPKEFPLHLTLIHSTEIETSKQKKNKKTYNLHIHIYKNIYYTGAQMKGN